MSWPAGISVAWVTEAGRYTAHCRYDEVQLLWEYRLARRFSPAWLTRTLVLVGLGLLIAGAAVFAAVFIYGRTALTTMSVRWAVIWAIAAESLRSGSGGMCGKPSNSTSLP